MFAKSKVSQSMIDAVNKVLSEQPAKEETLNESGTPIKEPTSTGMKVYGRSYGNSAKAKQDQTKHELDKIKGPKDSEVKEELKGNQDKIDANHNNKIDAQDFAILRNKKKMKESRSFTDKLLETVRKSDVPAYLRKAKGDTPLTMADAKGPKKDTISAPENLAKARNEEVEQIEERDEGKPGLMFKKIAAKAAKEYGSKEAGNRVAGAIRKKVLAKEEIEELSEEQLDEMLNEVLGKDATAGDWIHDFIHSKNPKFDGKSKAERKKMALGAYYGKQNEETYKNPDEDPITTDTLAGRMPGGKMNSFKSYKIGVKPSDKEGDGSVKEVDCEKPDSTPARKSIHAEATIAGTPGWEKVKNADTKGNVKDKSGAVHTPMSRAKDLARSAFKKLKNETMMGKAGTTSESKKKW